MSFAFFVRIYITFMNIAMDNANVSIKNLTKTKCYQWPLTATSERWNANEIR